MHVIDIKLSGQRQGFSVGHVDGDDLGLVLLDGVNQAVQRVPGEAVVSMRWIPESMNLVGYCRQISSFNIRYCSGFLRKCGASISNNRQPCGRSVCCSKSLSQTMKSGLDAELNVIFTASLILSGLALDSANLDSNDTVFLSTQRSTARFA